MLACILNWIYNIVTVYGSGRLYTGDLVEFVAGTRLTSQSQPCFVSQWCASLMSSCGWRARWSKHNEIRKQLQGFFRACVTPLFSWMTNFASIRLPNLWLPGYSCRAPMESKSSRSLSWFLMKKTNIDCGASSTSQLRDACGSSVLVQLFIRRSLYSHRACFLASGSP